MDHQFEIYMSRVESEYHMIYINKINDLGMIMNLINGKSILGNGEVNNINKDVEMIVIPETQKMPVIQNSKIYVIQINVTNVKVRVKN